MAKRKHPLLFLIGAILSLIVCILCIVFLSPNHMLPLGFVAISSQYLFLLGLFLFFFFLITYLFFSKIHGILIGLLMTTFLFLRSHNLTQPFFVILLLLLFLSLELFFSTKKT